MKTYTNGNIFGCSKETIDEDTNKRGVETVFSRKTGENGVTHTLRHDNSSDCETSNNLYVTDRY